jgi:hypothetical protein
MTSPSAQPRILFVSPEAVFVPADRVKQPHCKGVEQVGFGAFSAQLINSLCERGADVHVAQPDYRWIYATMTGEGKRLLTETKLPGARLHLAKDRIFFYAGSVAENSDLENTRIALNFQREVSHQILPRVQPDLIHCQGWMTGLIPAIARHRGIPCLFSVPDFRSAGSLLARIEDRGIDAAPIWQYLYYDRYPSNYEETREFNPLDFLLSAILAASHVSAVSLRLLTAMDVHQRHGFYARALQLLRQKQQNGCFSEMPLAVSSAEVVDRYSAPAPDRLGRAAVHGRYRPLGRLMHPLSEPSKTVQFFLTLYEKILQRPLILQPPAAAARFKKPERFPMIESGGSVKNRPKEPGSYRPARRQRSTPVLAT